MFLWDASVIKSAADYAIYSWKQGKLMYTSPTETKMCGLLCDGRIDARLIYGMHTVTVMNHAYVCLSHY